MRVVINAVSLAPGGGLTVLLGAVEALLENDCECYIYSANSDAVNVLRRRFPGNSRLVCHSLLFLRGGALKYLWSRFVLPCQTGVKDADALLSFNYHVPGVRNILVYHINLLHFMSGYSGLFLKRGVAGWLRDRASHASLLKAKINLFESKYLLDCARRFASNIRGEGVLYFSSGLRFEGNLPIKLEERTLNRVVAVTSDQPHKDNNTLVDMLAVLYASEFSDWQLVIVGGNTNSFSELKAYATQLNVLDKMIFVGRYTHTALAELLSHSLCLVTTSVVESFCMVAVEAMSVGCPVVVTECAAMPESVGPWGQIVPPGSSKDFAAAVIRYRKDRVFYENMVSGGLEFVGRYSKENFEAGLLSALRGMGER